MEWTTTIEVAFTTPPLSDSPAWTDITAYAVESPVGTNWGRADELDEASPSDMSVTLDNSDGRFSTHNTSSPYYPNVKAGRRIRVTVTHDGDDYIRFDGYLNAWPTTWEGGDPDRALGVITAIDKSKRLGTIGALKSALQHEVLADEPEFYYPLDEDTGSLAAGNVSLSDNQRPAAKVMTTGDGVITFGEGVGPGLDESSAAVWDAPHDDADKPIHYKRNSAWLAAPIDPEMLIDADTFALTYEVWAACAVTATIGTGYRFINAHDRSSIGTSAVLDNFGGASFGIDSDAHLYTFVRENGAAGGDPTGESITYTGKSYMDGATHHFVAVYEPTGTSIRVRLYVDGVQVHTDTYGDGGSFFTLDTLHIGEDAYFADGDSFLGTMSHVAVYHHALSPTRIAEHYDAGMTGFSGESSGARIERLARYAGIPAGQVDADTGASLMGPALIAGQGALEAMQEVAASEGGVLYIARDGDLTFRDRLHRYNVTSAITLDAEDNVLGEDITFPGDDAHLVNDITITQDPGPTTRRQDLGSIADYGTYADEIAVSTVSNEEAIDAADARLVAYADPLPRISSVTLRLHELEDDDPRIPLLLAADIGTRISVTNLPDNAPDTDMDLWVEGAQETVGDGQYVMTLSTSPVLPTQDDVWELGVVGRSTLGTDTKLSYGTSIPALLDGDLPTPHTWVDGSFPSAAMFNTELRDKLQWLMSPPSIKLTRSTDIPITQDSPGTWVPWNAEEYKDQIIHSTAANSEDDEETRPDNILIKYPGVYLIHSRIQWEGADTAWPNGRRDMSVWINLETLQAAQENRRQPAAGLVPTRLSVSTAYLLETDDTVRVRVYHTSGFGGEGLPITGSLCSFSAMWLAGP